MEPVEAVTLASKRRFGKLGVPQHPFDNIPI